MNQVLVPPLAFGQRVAKTSYCAEELASILATMKGWEAHYVPNGPDSAFVNQTASLNINGLALTAIAHAPMTTHVVAPNDCMMVFTTGGKGYGSVINGRTVNFERSKSAGYATEGVRIGRGDYRSVLMVDINKQRLMKTVTTMAGEENHGYSRLDLSIPHQLELHAGATALDAGFQQICGLLDLYCETPALLEAMAIDETIFRMLALLFQPKWLTEITGRSEHRANYQSRLDAACQYALAALDKPVTLTDLERVSNLSVRALQYAFQKRFGCSPMNWLRTQRLHLARRRLLAATPADSVTSVALSCGIPHLSQFSADYRKLFGETPSGTLARAAGR